ncbi:MAG: hypothetical protein PHF14_05710 [Verrucomicrobiota bacterium]|jgi:hypothetical protein|nr:hypothetical protein [Verrucomicrobiota bacterium]MDD8050057.1 hypothetical protein [Verrucomicrobiota bacterium]
MNIFLALLTGLALTSAGIVLLWEPFRRKEAGVPGTKGTEDSDQPAVPDGMVRLMIYECPRCERRNRLKEGLDPRFARCGRCFAEMGNATLVGEEIAPAQPDVSEDPAATWILRHEDLPASRASRTQGPARSVPRFEINTPLPEEIAWKSVDPQQTAVSSGKQSPSSPVPPERWPNVIGNVDPVTGTLIDEGEEVFICTHCTTAYHAQTWQFLQDQNAGACASCNRQKTIVPYSQPPKS